MLYQRIYVSTAVEPFDEQRLEELLRQSRSANSAVDVSGVLIYENGQFIQLLEGGREAVEGIFARVLRDPRHRNIITFLSAAAEGGRIFPGWSMGYFRLRRTGRGEEGLLDPDYAEAGERLRAHAGTPAATILANLIAAVSGQGAPPA